MPFATRVTTPHCILTSTRSAVSELVFQTNTNRIHLEYLSSEAEVAVLNNSTRKVVFALSRFLSGENFERATNASCASAWQLFLCSWF